MLPRADSRYQLLDGTFQPPKGTHVASANWRQIPQKKLGQGPLIDCWLIAGNHLLPEPRLGSAWCKLEVPLWASRPRANTGPTIWELLASESINARNQPRFILL